MEPKLEDSDFLCACDVWEAGRHKAFLPQEPSRETQYGNSGLFLLAILSSLHLCLHETPTTVSHILQEEKLGIVPMTTQLTSDILDLSLDLSGSNACTASMIISSFWALCNHHLLPGGELKSKQQPQSQKEQ